MGLGSAMTGCGPAVILGLVSICDPWSHGLRVLRDGTCPLMSEVIPRAGSGLWNWIPKFMYPHSGGRDWSPGVLGLLPVTSGQN